MRDDYILLVLGTRRSGKSTVTFGGSPLGEGIVDHGRAGSRDFIYDERGVVPGRSEWLRWERAARLHKWLSAEAGGQIPERKRPGAYYFRPALSQSKAEFWNLVAPGEGHGGRLKPGIAGTYYIDEAHNLAPATAKTNADFEEAISTGGNYGMSFVLLTRRYKQLDRTVRTQASAILSFAQPREDAQALAKEFDRRASVTAELEGHEFTLLGDRPGELPQREWLRGLGTYRGPDSKTVQ